jgi:molecular chaperone GrpE (heat shock protein)
MLEGINSVAEQIDVVLRKAGIKSTEPYKLERFEVLRYH